MAESKRIMVSLPGSLLEEMDGIAAKENMNRSEFIRESMKFYIRERQKKQIYEKMKAGYLEMTNINRTLAELGLTADNEALQSYEEYLSGSEES